MSDACLVRRPSWITASRQFATTANSVIPGPHTHRTTLLWWCFFFFQAEDGIRDYKVTGVQTCALPIYFLLIAGSTPLPMQKNWPTRDAADQFLEDYRKRTTHTIDTNDLLYAVNSSRN